MSTHRPSSPSAPAARPKRSRMTEEDFFAQLAALAGPDVVQFVRGVLRESPAHGLEVVWRAAGPALHFKHPKSPQRFSFGYFTRFGDCGFGWIADQCAKVGLPTSIGDDYLGEMERLLPGSQQEEQPLSLLMAHRTEWWAAVDRTVARLKQGLETA